MFDHMKHDRRLRDDGEEARDRRQRRRRRRRRGGFFLRAASSAGGTSARQRCARASPFEIRGAARILLGGLRSFLSRLSFHVRSFVGFVLVRSRPLPRTSRCKVARKGVSPAITTPSPRTETSSPRDTRDIMLLRSIFLLPAFVERRRLHSRDRDAVPWSSPGNHTSWRYGLDQNNSTVLCGGKEKERGKRVVYNDRRLDLIDFDRTKIIAESPLWVGGGGLGSRVKGAKKARKEGRCKVFVFLLPLLRNDSHQGWRNEAGGGSCWPVGMSSWHVTPWPWLSRLQRPPWRDSPPGARIQRG